ncbi:hypothetical protein FSP39_015237 [Pinctada imbricata]|uniref:Uncharacterized protein n=1 Tax=Pinctada imbricata TaxID=66713 RepID=A0AA88XSF8_PINIB|nr:hypothetical protein FSP39_015237 [Pinctada imbricata]
MGPSFYPRGQTVETVEAPWLTPAKDYSFSLEDYDLGFLGCRRQCTWEPEENILDPRLIKEFEKRLLKFPRKIGRRRKSEVENFKPFGSLHCPYGTQSPPSRRRYIPPSGIWGTERQLALNNRSGTLRENADYVNSVQRTDVTREGPLFDESAGHEKCEVTVSDTGTLSENHFTQGQVCAKYILDSEYQENKLCHCHQITENDKRCMEWIADTHAVHTPNADQNDNKFNSFQSPFNSHSFF